MTERKAKTVDGAPTPISSLNLESPDILKNSQTGVLNRVARFYSRLNDVMSGMYTGVGCAGTPHAYHSYNSKEQKQSEKPSD